jgi:hypothetical protein
MYPKLAAILDIPKTKFIKLKLVYRYFIIIKNKNNIKILKIIRLAK